MKAMKKMARLHRGDYSQRLWLKPLNTCYVQCVVALKAIRYSLWEPSATPIASEVASYGLGNRMPSFALTCSRNA